MKTKFEFFLQNIILRSNVDKTIIYLTINSLIYLSNKMLELEFHELFRPSNGSDPTKKSTERSPKASKQKNRRKQSMSREMREIASGILRQMLDKNNCRPAVGVLANSQSHPNQSNETPFIELKSNASEFSVFAAIRQSVLQKSIDNKFKESVMKVCIPRRHSSIPHSVDS